ncbi:UbiA family prenyltransferase [Planktomarina temperata]|nr:UbiA family prenyltransferase [Planktomarina temperata]
MTQNKTHSKEVPLVVDLDGSLTPVDTLHEAAVRFFATSPILALFRMFYWLINGKANLKKNLSRIVPLAPELLPMNSAVLSLISEAREIGRSVVLCTASDSDCAEAIARHLGCFDEVIASNGVENLAGANKANVLISRYGHGGYDYIGNASSDIPVWKHARKAIVVNSDRKLVRRAQMSAQVTCIIDKPDKRASTILRQLRPHQWSKNFLLFVPLMLSYQFSEAQAVITVFFSFIAFCIVASATYVINDLFDIASDRAHASKMHRPLASGDLSIVQALFLIFGGLLAGLTIAWFIGETFLFGLLSYIVVTIAYSMLLKKLVLIDVLALSGLYTLRILCGAIAINDPISPWLLIFSTFLFLSLGYLKRYVEVRQKKSDGLVSGRGYFSSDEPLVLVLGVGAAYTSLVLFSLYLYSEGAFQTDEGLKYILFTIPLLGYWMSYMWTAAVRDKMDHDPVLFTLRNKASLVVMCLILVLFLSHAGSIRLF